MSGALSILAGDDNYTREFLALVADVSISGVRVARELDRIAGTACCRDARDLAR